MKSLPMKLPARALVVLETHGGDRDPSIEAHHFAAENNGLRFVEQR